MIICRICGAECEDEFEMCPVCGAELLVEEAEEIGTQVDEAVECVIEKPTLVASVEDVVTAEIFKDMLKESGIAYSSGELESSMRVTFGGGFAAEDIYVDESNIEAAQSIYEEILNTEAQFDDEFFEDECEDI